MNKRSYVITSMIIFIMMVGLSWLLHDVVLSELYEITKSVWRNDSSKEVVESLMFFNHFVVSFVFVYLFTRGYRNKGWAEGVRYGLIFGLVISTSGAVEKFVMLDIPTSLALGWFMGTLFSYMILGLFTALIYRGKEA